MTKRPASSLSILKAAAGGVALGCAAGGLYSAGFAGGALGQSAAGSIVDPRSGCATSNPYPKDGESIAWFGACRDGKLDGPGLLIWYRNGFEAERDEGNFLAGELNGPAAITFADGNSIRGNYHMGERDGEFLVQTRDGVTFLRSYDMGKMTAERAATAEDVARMQQRPTTVAAAPAPQPPAPPSNPAPVASAPTAPQVPVLSESLPIAPTPIAPPEMAAVPPIPPPAANLLPLSPSPFPAPAPRPAAALNGASGDDVEVNLAVLAALRPGPAPVRALSPVKLRPPRSAPAARATTQVAARPAVYIDDGVIDGLSATRPVAYRPMQLAAVAPAAAPIVPDWYRPAALPTEAPSYAPPAYTPPPYPPAAAPTGAVTPEALFAEGYRHEREGRMREAETLYDTVYRLFAGTPMATLSGERLAWVRTQTSGLPAQPQPVIVAAAGANGVVTTPVPPAPAGAIPPVTAPAAAQIPAPMPAFPQAPIPAPVPPVQPYQAQAAYAQRTRLGAYLCTVDGLYSNNSRWCGVVRREYDRYYEVEVSKVTIRTPLAVGFNSSTCTGNKFIGYFSYGERVWVPQNCMAETP